jgi:hypothetical protein
MANLLEYLNRKFTHLLSVKDWSKQFMERLTGINDQARPGKLLVDISELISDPLTA